MKSLTYVLFIFVLSACASTEAELNPNVHSGAYAAEGFVFYTAPPEHPEWEPQDFYFKDCWLVGRSSNHISKVEFDCFYP